MLDEKGKRGLGVTLVIGTALFVVICSGMDFIESFVLQHGALDRAIFAGVATFVLALICGGLCWYTWRRL